MILGDSLIGSQEGYDKSVWVEAEEAVIGNLHDMISERKAYDTMKTHSYA